jgi:hypothetical protein
MLDSSSSPSITGNKHNFMNVTPSHVEGQGGLAQEVAATCPAAMIRVSGAGLGSPFLNFHFGGA